MHASLSHSIISPRALWCILVLAEDHPLSHDLPPPLRRHPRYPSYCLRTRAHTRRTEDTGNDAGCKTVAGGGRRQCGDRSMVHTQQSASACEHMVLVLVSDRTALGPHRTLLYCPGTLIYPPRTSCWDVCRHSDGSNAGAGAGNPHSIGTQHTTHDARRTTHDTRHATHNAGHTATHDTYWMPSVFATVSVLS